LSLERQDDRVSDDGPLTILCIATYEKGQEFLRGCKRRGCRVLLLTVDTLRDADWPKDAVDEFFYVPRTIAREDLLKGVSHIAQSRRIDRIVPLDDFDVEMAALLREHLRVPGMGETTARHFRDKLAMRVKARNFGILVPEFVHVLNDDEIRRFAENVPPPWVLKPRSQAAAIGIKKIRAADELWPAIQALGDDRSFSLLERFVPGEVYHVDSLVWERDVIFHSSHKYGAPPMTVAHEGGIFSTRTLPKDAGESKPLAAINREVLTTLGLVRGVAHTEFIRGAEDGRYYFLETSARVGGAFIVEVVEAATGVNLWREWANIEIAGEDQPYHLPPVQDRSAGIALTLARQEAPDTSAYTDPEIVTRVAKKHHAGLIVASTDPKRIEALLAQYVNRFTQDFYAYAPVPDRPSA
jgi:biotin carboxylase